MDLKWITLLMEVLLVFMIISTSSAYKKRKRTSSRPHVHHVSKEAVNSLTRNTDNSLTNTLANEHRILTKPKSDLKKSKKPKRTIKVLRRLIAKRKHIKNPQKRKRVLNRLRKELAKLKRRTRSHLKKCKSSMDCGADECCIKKFTLKGIGRCKKRPKVNQRCRPALLPGLDIECPCRLGLTCTPFKRSKKGYLKYRCESIPVQEGEIDPQAITGLGRFR